MCEIQVGHTLLEHRWSSHYAGLDQGCSAKGEEEEGAINSPRE